MFDATIERFAVVFFSGLAFFGIACFLAWRQGFGWNPVLLSAFVYGYLIEGLSEPLLYIAFGKFTLVHSGVVVQIVQPHTVQWMLFGGGVGLAAAVWSNRLSEAAEDESGDADNQQEEK